MINVTDGMRAIADFIKKNDSFALIMHRSPDGDTVGSALALYSMLKLMNKRVIVVCHDKMPRTYDYLPRIDEVIAPECATNVETAIAIDCGDIERLGDAKKLFEDAKNTISIDHHGTNTMFAGHNVVITACAATGEIIQQILKCAYCVIPASVADCLYTALMTDTGNFSYSNTTADTLDAAADLVRLGANPAKLNQRVYKTVPYSKTRLLGCALSKIELYHDGLIGLCVVTQEDMAQCGAVSDDTEGIVEHIRDIDSMELAIFIRECRDGSFKASMRSNNRVDVAALAQNFGGGGHVRAAGFNAKMGLEEMLDMLLNVAEETLEAQGI